MLKGIDPLLSPDLLRLLAEMGHDDALVLADANFIAMRPGAGTRVLRLPGVGLVRALQAVTSLLPLAEDIPHPVAYMQVGGTEPPYRSALQREAVALLAGLGLDSGQAEGVERFAFYERARKAYAIVVTGDLQPWANFILRKCVICASLPPGALCRCTAGSFLTRQPRPDAHAARRRKRRRTRHTAPARLQPLRAAPVQRARGVAGAAHPRQPGQGRDRA